MLKQTPLHRLHLELGGKMTAFAGYQLPIHYPTGIIREHLHCRSHAGFFDISHMGQFLISGDKAVEELEGLTPSDITGLNPGQQKYTVLTNDEGGVIDDIIVTRLAYGLKIIVNAACKEKDFNYLSNRLSHRCHLVELSDHALLALQGPAAFGIIRKYSEAAANLRFMISCEAQLAGIICTISRSGYTGEDGFEISVASIHAEALARRLLAEQSVMPVGLGARDTLRLEAGLCLYGHELTESITPVEAGLTWLIKKDRNNFPGADTIIRQLQQGPKKNRVGLVVEGKIPVRESSDLVNASNDVVGHVTSGSYAPSLNNPIAIAMVDSDYSVIGSDLFAKVRERKIDVTVTRLPFISHRYHR